MEFSDCFFSPGIRFPEAVQIEERTDTYPATKYNAYFGENMKLMTVVAFIALLTAHIPAKHKHLIWIRDEGAE